MAIINTLKKIPIEAYALIIFPGIGILAMLLFDSKAFTLKTLLFFLFYNNRYFLVIFALLYLYFVVKLLLTVFLSISRQNTYRSAFVKYKKLIQDQIYFTAMICFSGAFFDALINQLSAAAARQKIIATSMALANLDYAVFGRDLLFWINNFVNHTGGKVLAWMLLGSYDMLSWVLTVFVLALLIFNKTLAKKFLLFFFVILFISIPLWHVMPALNPMGFYVDNILKAAPPARIAQNLKTYHPDTVLASYQASLLQSYKSYNGFLDITSFPSMHAGFSVGIIICAFLLWPPLLFLLLPWFFLEMGGAIYYGQHYGVDLLFGILVALTAYCIVELLLLLEKKYYTGKGSFFIIDTIQRDAEVFLSFCKQTLALVYEFRNKNND